MALKVYKLKSGVLAQYNEGNEPDGAVLAPKAKAAKEKAQAEDVLEKAQADVQNKSAKAKNK